MAGEMLVQFVDIEAYAALLPTLDAMDAGGALAPPHRAALRDVCERIPEARPERRLIERLLAAPDLELKWFLSPTELDAALEAALFWTCLDEGGDWAARGGALGATALVERAIPAMRARPIFERVFFSESPEADALAYPARGEARSFLVRRADLAQLCDEAAALMAAPPEDAFAHEELDDFHKVAVRAATTPGGGMSFRFLL